MVWIGIDLGTTYSCMAYVDRNHMAEVVNNSEGERTTPSVVRYSDGNVVVGKIAKDEIEVEKDNTVVMVKRLMGGVTPMKIDGVDYLPEQISSEIIKRLVNDFTISTGQEVEGVVVTHPAYFGSAEIEATRKAVELAGIINIRTLTEPVAAAIDYDNYIATHINAGDHEEGPKERVVLVYDLGGGTFDATLIKQEGAKYTVIAIDGDKYLGGNNWDLKLREIFLRKLGKTSDDISTEDKAYLFPRIEGWKKSLTQGTSVRAPYQKQVIQITRSEFEEETKELIDSTGPAIDNVIKVGIDKGAIKSIDDISVLLLVGGSSRMPQVESLLRSKFPTMNIRMVQDPDLTVARGAAIYSTMPEDNVINVLSKTFGVISLDKNEREWVSNILFRQTTLPAKNTRHFTPHANGQTTIHLRVYENEEPSELDTDPRESTEIGSFKIPLRPNSTINDDIKTTFEVNESGTIYITVECEGMPPFKDKLNYNERSTTQSLAAFTPELMLD